MVLGYGNNLRDFPCDDRMIKSSLSEKILGLTIKNNLSDRISNICKTANQKLNALFR